MRQISLSRGFVAIVDDADYDRVSQFKWYAHVQRHTVYALRSVRKPDGKWTTRYLHRFILGLTDPKIDVDHRDHNGLHNWRGNLRIATRSQNQANRGKCSGASRYRGVSWNKRHGKWSAQIKLNGRRIHLGYFTDEVQAALTYDAAARELHGEFASRNFPPKKSAVSDADSDAERAC